MADDHWFDALNKALVQDVPRQSMLRAVAASLLLGGVPAAGAARNKKRTKKGKGNGKGKGKGKGKKDKGKKRKDKNKRPPPAPPCSGGLCAQTWPGNDTYSTDQRNYCEFICDQCAVGDREFCIIGGFTAGCCDEGLTCCDGQCANLLENDRHCGTCNNRCSLGRECFGGDCECRAEFTECGDTCRDTLRDENNCGGCGVICEEDERCCNGGCTDMRFDNSHCGLCNNACPAGAECCHGRCHDPQSTTCCRDFSSAWPICYLPSVCCGTPENPGCCLEP